MGAVLPNVHCTSTKKIENLSENHWVSINKQLSKKHGVYKGMNRQKERQMDGWIENGKKKKQEGWKLVLVH